MAQYPSTGLTSEQTNVSLSFEASIVTPAYLKLGPIEESMHRKVYGNQGGAGGGD